MDEGEFEWTSMCLVFDIRLNGVIPVEIDQDRRHLISLGKAVDGSRNDIFLSMPVEQDLLAKTGVPEPGDDRAQIGCECIFIHRDRAWHPDVMIGVAAKPDRLRDRTA